MSTHGAAAEVAAQATRPERAVAYLRCSTPQQQENTRSLDQQLEDIRDYCQRRGYGLHPGDVYQEVYTGTKPDLHTRRKDFWAMIGRLERGDVTVIVGWDVKRLGRNTVDNGILALKCHEYAVRLEVVGRGGVNMLEDEDTELMFDIDSAFAKRDRRKILKGSARGKKHANARGLWVNGPAPFGYTADGPRGMKALRPNEHAPIVQEVFRRYAAGETSSSIVRWLRTLGLTKRLRGVDKPIKWTVPGVAFVLDNEAYLGLVSWRGTTVRGQHPALVDAETWEGVRARRAAARQAYIGWRTGGRRKAAREKPRPQRATCLIHGPDRMLALPNGLVICEACGADHVRAPKPPVS